jgi:hypothetical protein
VDVPLAVGLHRGVGVTLGGAGGADREGGDERQKPERTGVHGRQPRKSGGEGEFGNQENRSPGGRYALAQGEPD